MKEKNADKVKSARSDFSREISKRREKTSPIGLEQWKKSGEMKDQSKSPSTE